MTQGSPRRLILIGERARGSFVAGLRSLGHEVSVVKDVDEAEILLTSGGFDGAVIPARSALTVLQSLSRAELSDVDAWRESSRAATAELRELLDMLNESFSEDGKPPAGATRRIEALTGLLGELLEDLDSGRGDEFAGQAMRLEDVIDAAALSVYPSANKRNQRLAIDIDEEVAVITADRSKLRRVMSKLLLHACRQSEDTGNITVRAVQDGADCVISVSYEGGPRSLVELRELFEPAGTAGEAGRLAWVQKLVAMHGGRLWVESERGDGTSVFVSLPGAVMERPLGAGFPGGV